MMTLFQNFKNKLSTSLKFVALLSVTFQLVVISLLIFRIDLDVFFLFFYVFYLFSIVVGFSRYVEVKSKNVKEKATNFFWLLNCFPFIFIALYSFAWALMQSPIQKEETIDSENVNFIIKDSNGNQIEKNVEEMKFDVKNKKYVDSIIQIKIKE